MDLTVSAIFLCAFIFSSSASVVLSPYINNVTLCLGETGPCRRIFTCDVNGSQLVWDFTGFSEISFTTSATSTRSFDQAIEVKLLSIYNGVIRSMATVNSTSAINETTLQCRNQLFETGSIREEVDFSVLYTNAVTQITLEAMKGTSNIIIRISWPMATCAAMYKLNIKKNGVNQPESTTINERTLFMFNVIDSGIYTFNVNSVDYYGMGVGDPVSTSISINTPVFNVSHVVNCMDETLSLIIQENSSVPQLNVLSCVVLLTNDSFDATMSCIGKNVLNFNIAVGGLYDYNVTVTNLFGSLSILNVTNTSMCIETTATHTTITVPETTAATQTTMTTDISPSVSPSASPNATNATASTDNTTYIATSASFGSLFGLLLVFLVFERLRCFCPTASFWSIVFCDCLAKGEKKTMPFDGEEIPNKMETNVSSDL